MKTLASYSRQYVQRLVNAKAPVLVRRNDRLEGGTVIRLCEWYDGARSRFSPRSPVQAIVAIRPDLPQAIVPEWLPNQRWFSEFAGAGGLSVYTVGADRVIVTSDSHRHTLT